MVSSPEPTNCPSKHDPEKWEPVFGKDHAQTSQSDRVADLTARDARLHAFRSDLADARLKGEVVADHFVAGRPARIAASVADVRKAPRPDAGVNTQLLLGDDVLVFGVHPSAGKGDLSRMIREVGAALGEEQRQPGFTIHERDQHGGFARRSFPSREPPSVAHPACGVRRRPGEAFREPGFLRSRGERKQR